MKVNGYEITSGANLHRANLRGANLVMANLRRADLRGANLGGANLRGADLRGSNLRGADLSRADLRGANLYGADLYGADLSGADLRGANLYGADLSRADLRGADLHMADLLRANFFGANLSGAIIDDKKIKSFRIYTSNMYAYTVQAILFESGERYIRMGCLWKTLEQWELGGGIRKSNLREFPDDGSEKSEERAALFEMAKSILLKL